MENIARISKNTETNPNLITTQEYDQLFIILKTFIIHIWSIQQKIAERHNFSYDQIDVEQYLSPIKILIKRNGNRKDAILADILYIVDVIIENLDSNSLNDIYYQILTGYNELNEADLYISSSSSRFNIKSLEEKCLEFILKFNFQACGQIDQSQPEPKLSNILYINPQND